MHLAGVGAVVDEVADEVVGAAALRLVLGERVADEALAHQGSGDVAIGALGAGRVAVAARVVEAGDAEAAAAHVAAGVAEAVGVAGAGAAIGRAADVADRAGLALAVAGAGFALAAVGVAGGGVAEVAGGVAGAVDVGAAGRADGVAVDVGQAARGGRGEGAAAVAERVAGAAEADLGIGVGAVVDADRAARNGAFEIAAAASADAADGAADRGGGAGDAGLGHVEAGRAVAVVGVAVAAGGVHGFAGLALVDDAAGVFTRGAGAVEADVAVGVVAAIEVALALDAGAAVADFASAAAGAVGVAAALAAEAVGVALGARGADGVVDGAGAVAGAADAFERGVGVELEREAARATAVGVEAGEAVVGGRHALGAGAGDAGQADEAPGADGSAEAERVAGAGVARHIALEAGAADAGAARAVGVGAADAVVGAHAVGADVGDAGLAAGAERVAGEGVGGGVALHADVVGAASHAGAAADAIAALAGVCAGLAGEDAGVGVRGLAGEAILSAEAGAVAIDLVVDRIAVLAGPSHALRPRAVGGGVALEIARAGPADIGVFVADRGAHDRGGGAAGRGQIGVAAFAGAAVGFVFAHDAAGAVGVAAAADAVARDALALAAADVAERVHRAVGGVVAGAAAPVGADIAGGVRGVSQAGGVVCARAASAVVAEVAIGVTDAFDVGLAGIAEGVVAAHGRRAADRADHTADGVLHAAAVVIGITAAARSAVADGASGASERAAFEVGLALSADAGDFEADRGRGRRVAGHAAGVDDVGVAAEGTDVGVRRGVAVAAGGVAIAGGGVAGIAGAALGGAADVARGVGLAVGVVVCAARASLGDAAVADGVAIALHVSGAGAADVAAGFGHAAVADERGVGVGVAGRVVGAGRALSGDAEVAHRVAHAVAARITAAAGAIGEALVAGRALGVVAAATAGIAVAIADRGATGAGSIGVASGLRGIVARVTLAAGAVGRRDVGEVGVDADRALGAVVVVAADHAFAVAEVGVAELAQPAAGHVDAAAARAARHVAAVGGVFVAADPAAEAVLDGGLAARIEHRVVIGIDGEDIDAAVVAAEVVVEAGGNRLPIGSDLTLDRGVAAVGVGDALPAGAEESAAAFDGDAERAEDPVARSLGGILALVGRGVGGVAGPAAEVRRVADRRGVAAADVTAGHTRAAASFVAGAGLAAFGGAVFVLRAAAAGTAGEDRGVLAFGVAEGQSAVAAAEVGLAQRPVAGAHDAAEAAEELVADRIDRLRAEVVAVAQVEAAVGIAALGVVFASLAAEPARFARRRAADLRVGVVAAFAVVETAAAVARRVAEGAEPAHAVLAARRVEAVEVGAIGLLVGRAAFEACGGLGGTDAVLSGRGRITGGAFTAAASLPGGVASYAARRDAEVQRVGVVGEVAHRRRHRGCPDDFRALHHALRIGRPGTVERAGAAVGQIGRGVDLAAVGVLGVAVAEGRRAALDATLEVGDAGADALAKRAAIDHGAGVVARPAVGDREPLPLALEAAGVIGERLVDLPVAVIVDVVALLRCHVTLALASIALVGLIAVDRVAELIDPRHALLPFEGRKVDAALHLQPRIGQQAAAIDAGALAGGVGVVGIHRDLARLPEQVGVGLTGATHLAAIVAIAIDVVEIELAAIGRHPAHARHAGRAADVGLRATERIGARPIGQAILAIAAVLFVDRAVAVLIVGRPSPHRLRAADLLLDAMHRGADEAR